MDGGFVACNGWGIYDLRCGYGLNGWASYGKVSCCFIWKYAQKTLVFRGVHFPITGFSPFELTCGLLQRAGPLPT